MKQAQIKVSSSDDTKKVLSALEMRLNKSDKPQQVVIKDFEETRRDRQNKYMWLLHAYYGDQVGYYTKEVHLQWKKEILVDLYIENRKTVLLGGIETSPEVARDALEQVGGDIADVAIDKLFRTRDLTVKLFSIYITRIKDRAAMQGYVLPSAELYGIEGII